MKRSLLESTENTRPVGHYRAVWRSDAPHSPTKEDIRILREKQITTLLDLREDASVRKHPCTLAGMAEFRYLRCPITEGSGLPASPELVPVSYLEIAESPGTLQALREIADAPAGVCFFCTAGKDRTGVLSALLLLLAGAEDGEIVSDYLRTKEFAAGRLAAVRELFPEADPKIYTPCTAHMETFLRLLRKKYGCAERFLTIRGLTPAQFSAIRRKMTEYPV